MQAGAVHGNRRIRVRKRKIYCSAEVFLDMQAEAEFTKAAMADTEALQERLFKEMRGRIQEADESAPLRCCHFGK